MRAAAWGRRRPAVRAELGVPPQAAPRIENVCPSVSGTLLNFESCILNSEFAPERAQQPAAAPGRRAAPLCRKPTARLRAGLETISMPLGIGGPELRPAKARSSSPQVRSRAFRKLRPEYHFSLLIFHFSFAVPERNRSGPQPPPGGDPQLTSRRSALCVSSAGCAPN